MKLPRLCLLILGSVFWPACALAADGASLFVKNCQTCHSVEKGAAARQGPPLHGVIGRKAGTVEGFKYSDGLKAAGWVWTPERIDEWITFPKKMIRDTVMLYRQSDPAIRKAIVDYIASQKD